MKRIICIVLALSLIAGFSACNKDGEESINTETTEEFAEETLPAAVPLSDNESRLTGLPLPENHSTRPVGFMVPNDPMTIGNQPHIDEADFYMECETEGAIPRLLVAFSSAESIPDTFGPIRSARSPFVATARSLGLIYVHAGGSKPADAILDTGVLDRVNALTDDGTLFYRDPELKSRIDYVHSLVADRDDLIKRIDSRGISREYIKETPFNFNGEFTGNIDASEVTLKSTPSTAISFKFDTETELYGKYLSSGKPHASLEGDQIQVNNVLILYAEKYVDIENGANTIYNFRNGEGTGYLISGGTAEKIKYNRQDDSLSFTRENGMPLIFSKGKTYMVLADKNLADTVSFS